MKAGSSADAESRRGLVASLRNLAASLVSTAQTRLQLLSNEIQEEGLRLLWLWLFATLAIFFFSLAVLLITFFIIVMFWDGNRLLVIGLLAALYLGVALALALAAAHRAGARSQLFAASIAELKKDRGILSP